MGVLSISIEQRTAVGIHRRDVNAVFAQQRDKQVSAHCCQVAGQNPVVVGRSRARVLEQVLQRVAGSRG